MSNHLLQALWKEIEMMLSEGLNLIAVREKDDEYGNAKSPYKKWQEFQQRRITKEELWHQMDSKNTASAAIVCGKISGNLEVLDVDSKQLPGCDGMLFSQIATIYPELFQKIRRHRSRSGGYHLLWKISDHDVPGNLKLAGREATEDELKIKPKDKIKYFFETRGEGGIIVAPPSIGYSVSNDVPIPTITWEERCSIINIAMSFTKIVEPVKEKKAHNFKSDYYDEDPFSHFNGSEKGADVLLEFGWTLVKDLSLFTWYTRPGGKRNNVHGSFDKEKQCFHLYATNADISGVYKPATILRLLKFNGDGKETHKYLVSQGFGKISEYREKEIIKKGVTNKLAPPPNLSESALNEFKEKAKEAADNYPYDIFWEYNEKAAVVISREKLYQVAEGLGFRLHQGKPVRIINQIIHRQEEREFQDVLKAYIHPAESDIIDIYNAFEAFIQHNGTFTISRLPLLQTELILKDTRKDCFKFYQNGYVHITATEIRHETTLPDEVLIWAHKIQPRNYAPANGGMYPKFLSLATDFETNSAHILSCIGYLSHDYKDETTAYIIILTEQCENPKDGGGTGKNIFCRLFEHTISITNKPGEQVKYDERFFQSWNGERLFIISDIPEHFNFVFLKEPSSGSLLLKKLFKDERTVNVEDGPKFMAQTQFSYSVTDGGLRRRMIPIEFTNFFTKAGGVDVHFGKMFPLDWSDEDWAGFDYIITTGVQLWLSSGLKLKAPELSIGGASKQFEQSYGHWVHVFIKEHADLFKRQQEVSNDEFKALTSTFYQEYEIPEKYRPSSQKYNEGFEHWCKSIGYKFQANVTVRTGPLSTQKGRKFLPPEETPF